MNKEISKFLSMVLRHDPSSIGLTLSLNGWADIHELIAKAEIRGKSFSYDELIEVVRTNDKQRFTISADGQRIRAAQGHSIAVDLALAPIKPPLILFHGTAVANVEAILRDGLRPGLRQQVHLSADQDTARMVGLRHGKPAVLSVAAGQMHLEGFKFFLSDNGVWLIDAVPPQFIEL